MIQAEDELYRTPSLATLSAERLTQVVQENRHELIALDRDHAYRSAHWALELIDSLAGRVRQLEATTPPVAHVPEPEPQPEPKGKRAARG